MREPRFVIRARTLVWACYLLAIIVLSLIPVTLPQTAAQEDKILHFLAYGGLAALWPHWHARGPRAACWAALVGAVLEVAQGVLPTGRCMDAWDAVANALGAVLGASMIWVGRDAWERIKPGGGTR